MKVCGQVKTILCDLNDHWWDIFLTKYWGVELTECQLLPWVRGQSEAEERHAGDENTGDDEVEEIVESPPPDVDGEGDVHVGLRAAVVRHAVLLPGHP